MTDLDLSSLKVRSNGGIARDADVRAARSISRRLWRNADTDRWSRGELIDEHREHSGGKNLRLCSFYQLLDEMKVAGNVIEEIKSAEVAANTAICEMSSGWSRLCFRFIRKRTSNLRHGLIIILRRGDF